MGNHKSKLSPRALRELVNSTFFNESEVRAWYKTFLRDCPSGLLTLEEFKKCCAGFFESGNSTEYAERAFRSFDTNGNGSIDFREFMCALSVTSRGNFEQKLKWAFRMYDTDNDGCITKDEVELMIGAIHKLIGDELLHSTMSDNMSAQQRAELIFKKMDKDGDEHVTVEEFTIAAKQDPSLTMLFQLGGQVEHEGFAPEAE